MMARIDRRREGRRAAPGRPRHDGGGLVCLGFAVSVDYPRTAKAFKGDEATYYSLTYSIARDGDFTFQRQDLIRVWEEFSGPDGIFLKRGSNVDFRRSSTFPFFVMERTPDSARGRLYYGKSYIYPLFAAPFVWLFGTTGFLVFHALLLTLNLALASRYLAARGSSPAWRPASRRVSVRLGDAGLFRVARAGAVQFHAGPRRVLSLELQAGRSAAGAGPRGSNGSCARLVRTTRRSCCSASRRFPSRRTSC